MGGQFGCPLYRSVLRCHASIDGSIMQLDCPDHATAHGQHDSEYKDVSRYRVILAVMHPSKHDEYDHTSRKPDSKWHRIERDKFPGLCDISHRPCRSNSGRPDAEGSRHKPKHEKAN